MRSVTPSLCNCEHARDRLARRGGERRDLRLRRQGIDQPGIGPHRIGLELQEFEIDALIGRERRQIHDPVVARADDGGEPFHHREAEFRVRAHEIAEEIPGMMPSLHSSSAITFADRGCPSMADISPK